MNIYIGSNQVKRKYKWRLTGEEILLQLEVHDRKHRCGIYAYNPFDRNSRLQLLIPGGERPCWSLTRKFFAYLKGEWLYVVRSDGSEEAEIAYSLGDSDYHFHDPTVIWSWEDEYAVVEHNSAFGSKVLIGWRVESLLSKKYSPSPAPGSSAVPLLKQIERESPKREAMWSVLANTNNPTFSPDGKHVAMEVYPSPMDLRRRESRIWIYGFLTDADLEKKPPERWFFGGGPLKGPGRRLTSLTGDNCELMPLWSPTGEWIAFTLVDFEKGFVAPVVIRPDGSDMTMLLPAEDMYFWPSKEWMPIGTWLTKAVEFPLSENSWGYPNIIPVEWSPDGKYLLLNQGKRFSILMVAKWEGGEMVGKRVMGADGDEVVAVCYMGAKRSLVRLYPGATPISR